MFLRFLRFLNVYKPSLDYTTFGQKRIKADFSAIITGISQENHVLRHQLITAIFISFPLSLSLLQLQPAFAYPILVLGAAGSAVSKEPWKVPRSIHLLHGNLTTFNLNFLSAFFDDLASGVWFFWMAHCTYIYSCNLSLFAFL